MNKILSQLVFSFFNLLFILFVTLTLLSFSPAKKPAKAQEIDYQCIGKAVAEYMNTVINLAGNLQHVKLLSPAFNLTNPATEVILNSMNNNGAKWDGLDAYAGNAYHVSEQPVMHWVNQFYGWAQSIGMPTGLDLMITETGDHDCSPNGSCTAENYLNLGNELNEFRESPYFLGALFFNVFNTNPGFSGFQIPDDQIQTACGDSCSQLGANSATYYPESSSFYDKTKSYGMTYTLSISNADSSTTEGILLAHQRGLIPIIRVGTRSSSGPTAETYANYLISLDSQVNNTVYAIAGPNEPDLEYWASPYCATGPLPGDYIPCDATTEDEWHSLRPYRKSPCNLQTMDLALFCGNDFILMDSLPFQKVYNFSSGVSWSYSFEGSDIQPFPKEPPATACSYCDASRNCVQRSEPCDNTIGCNITGCGQVPCRTNDDGTETCFFNVERSRNIAVDLSDSYFPIMGLTEDPYVVNRQTPSDQFDDPKKVNEYVSWYLNGTIGRAEYDPPNVKDKEQQKRLVNFSGPLKKLLSFESQIVRRIKEIEKSDEVRHNQIIGCHDGLGNPTKCYPSSAPRLRLKYWADKLPPLRKAYDTFGEYWREFKWWRDRNFGKLFSYIPFSSTEDRKGKVEMSSYSVQPPISGESSILFSEILNQKPADLFFAHMQESEELGRLFQKIFTPNKLSQPGAAIDKPADPQVVPYSPFCDIAEIRSNPGDDLFAGEFSATINYTAQASCDFLTPGEGRICKAATGGNCYNLPVTNWYCDAYYTQVDCGDGQFCGKGCKEKGFCIQEGGECDLPGSSERCCPGFKCKDDDEDPNTPKKCVSSPIGQRTPDPYTESCNVSTPISFKTETSTPLADSVWARLVAGPASVFRRLFPQIKDEVGRPLKALWDIPGASPVTYRSLDGLTVLAGNPRSNRLGGNAELYFPHIGGIHEYFLQCIQKVLRPQGFGGDCTSAGNPFPYPNPSPPPGAGRCQLGTYLCSPEYLENWWDGCRARQASIICNRESGGNPSAINDSCLSGGTLDYSIGLFQINLLAHCDGAFEYGKGPPPWCTIIDPEKVEECKEKFYNPDENAQYAFQLSNGGENWNPWGAYDACKTVVDSQCP